MTITLIDKKLFPSKQRNNVQHVNVGKQLIGV